MDLHYKNIEISYTDTGSGNTIILLHGFLENQTMWEFFVQQYSQSYRVITIDLLGHGKTPCIGYVHTMEDQADVVYAVVNHLQVSNAIIMGHSMGGYIALAFANLYPEMVKGIVLSNSSALEDNPEKKANRVRAIKAVKQDAKNFVRISIANLFSEDNRERLADEIEVLKKQAVKTPQQGIIAALEGMKMREDRQRLLHEGKFAILLVLGEKDQSLPYQDHAPQAEATAVQLVTYPNGHMAHIENRDALLAETLAFFKQVFA
ncbi:alpha/beta fold hydrolase [Flavobacterium rhizosphaerae]|uniref:Alpha/beta hydrolase n=1 Tax=Flavobacterium rhizosphaerae TaxID=3163298 RepID=A0ABW8YZP5_9FLAO